MGRRSGYANTLILRGESPEFDDMDDEFGGGGGGDEEFGDEFGNENEDDMYKGRRVNGPRTKLSASMDGRIDRMEAGITRLAKGMTLFGRYLQSQQHKARVAKHGEPDGDEFGMGDDAGMGGGGSMGGYEEEEDPMAIPPDDGDEDHLDLAVGPQLRATGEGTNLNVRKAKLAKAKLAKAQLAKAAAIVKGAGYTIGRVSKDDAASSFGEKDSNAPGNRPFDQEDVGEEDTVIQGGPGAGPGPVSKGSGSESFESRVQKAMVPTLTAVLEAYGLQPQRPVQLPDMSGARVMKAMSPNPGGTASFDSKIDNAAGGPDLNQLFDQLKTQSFGSINRLRVEMGDLTGGIL